MSHLRIFPLSLIFALSVANAQNHNNSQHLVNSQSLDDTNAVLVLEPEGDIHFCGTVPLKFGDRVVVDISNFAVCVGGRDRLDTLYNCSVAVSQRNAWQRLEELFAEGQRLGRIGKIAIPAGNCTKETMQRALEKK